MPRSMLRVGQRYFVWVLAAMAAAETVVEAVAAAYTGDLGLFAIWVGGSGGIFMLGAFVERVKTLEDQY